MRLVRTALSAVLAVLAGTSVAAPVTYAIDPTHTFPSFEADHLGGLSTWRGKFNATRGTVVLDREAGTGTVDITIDVASIDYGLDAMNEAARGEMLFDVARHPEARYVGTLAGFEDGRPTRVDGRLTLKGVTRPVTLTLRTFKCMPHPVEKRELCGADAHARLQRDAFGLAAGKDYGFDMGVDLRIQVEALGPVAK